MAFLKKRSTASAVLIAVIVVFTVLGMNLSASRAAAKTEKLFYEGVYLKDEGYTEKSVASQLDARSDAAGGLATLLSGAEAEALREARNELDAAASISEKYAANEKLEAAYKAAEKALSAEAASSDAAKHYLSALSGAESAIERSGYNAAAEKANGSVLSGVLRPLRLLVASDGAEYFASK